jgi:hypothetical protein
MAKIEVEFTLKNGDKVKTSNEAIIAQLKETGAEYKIVGDTAEETATKQVEANEKVAKSYQEILSEYKANVKELNALAIAGDTNSERFQELQQKVAGAKDALEDNSRAIAANKSFGDALVGSISGIAGGFAAAQGIIGTFAGESEGLQKALLKVQSALAFAQGVEQLKDAKDSFLALGNSVKGPVVSAFNGLKGAIGATGIGLLVIGIGLLITNFDKVKNAVLNFIPGLAQVGEFIGNLITAITDFIGLTSEAERQAEALNKSSQKRVEASKNEIEILRARGASADVIYKKEREQANARIADLNKIQKLNKKLTEDELKERTELIQKIKVLDAAETKRKEDEAKKAADAAAAAAKEAAEKATAARKEAEAKREAAEKINAKRRVELIEDETKRAFAALELQYQEELKAAKKNGEDTTLVKQLYEKRKAELTENIAKESAKKQEEVNKLLNDLEEKATDLTIERKIQLYNKDFDAYAKIEREKLKDASDVDKARLEEYLKLLREKGEADLKYNDELKKIEENSKLEQFKVNEQYYKDIAAIQADDTLTFEQKQQKIAQIDAKYKQLQLQQELAFINEKIKIAEKDPTSDPVKLAELKDTRLKLEKEIADGALKIQDDAAKKTKEASEKGIKDIAENIAEIAQVVSSVLSEIASFFDAYYAAQEEKVNSYYEDETEKLNEEKENQLAQFGQTEEQRAAIEQEYALKEQQLAAEQEAKLKEIKKKQADVEFAITVAQIIANTAASIASAVAASPLTGGLPFSAINAAIGAIQLATAIQQRTATQALAKGGILTGPSHAQGGIMIPGTGIEVEGGEAVINRRSTALYGPLLSAINQAGGGNQLVPNYFGTMQFGGQIGFNETSISSAVQEGILAGTQTVATRAYIVSTDVQNDIVRTSRLRRQTTF